MDFTLQLRILTNFILFLISAHRHTYIIYHIEGKCRYLHLKALLDEYASGHFLQ